MEHKYDGWSVTNRVCNPINPCIPPLSSLLSDGVVIRNTRVGTGVAVRVENRVIRSVVFGSWRWEGVRIRNGWVGGRWCGFVGRGEGGWVRRARSWVWRLVSEFVVRGLEGRGGLGREGTVEVGVGGGCEEGGEGGEGWAAAEGGAEHGWLSVVRVDMVLVVGGCLVLRVQWKFEGRGCLGK